MLAGGGLPFLYRGGGGGFVAGLPWGGEGRRTGTGTFQGRDALEVERGRGQDEEEAKAVAEREKLPQGRGEPQPRGVVCQEGGAKALGALCG